MEVIIFELENGGRDEGREGVIRKAMATVHMSEAEVARDLHAVLAKVQQGVEIVIEQDHRPRSSSSGHRIAAVGQ